MMGREIRKVPPNWSYPTKTDRWGRPQKQPMYSGSYAEAERDWLAELDEYRANGMGENAEYYPTLGDSAKDCPFPDPANYTPWAEADATWFQVWETVSEGTPVSPPFATQDELIAYLAANGDEWDQSRGDPAWGHDRAERFVKAGWAPSFVLSGGVLRPGTAAA